MVSLKKKGESWKFSRHWVKAGRIGDPTGRNVEPWLGRSLLLGVQPTSQHLNNYFLVKFRLKNIALSGPLTACVH